MAAEQEEEQQQPTPALSDHQQDNMLRSSSEDQNDSTTDSKAEAVRQDTETDIPAPPGRSEEFRVGDHVYQWCRYGGIPGIYQKHGMVLQVDDDSVTILEFHKLLPTEDSSSSSSSAPSSSPSSAPSSSPSSALSSSPSSAPSSSLWFGFGKSGDIAPVVDGLGEEEPVDEEDLPEEEAPLVTHSFDNAEEVQESDLKESDREKESDKQDAWVRYEESTSVLDVAATTRTINNTARCSDDNDDDLLPSFPSLVQEAVRRGHATRLLMKDNADASAADDKRWRRWRRVVYNAGAWRLSVQRSGTCTSARCDATGLVLSRVQFLLQRHACHLPQRHALFSNGECVAVWCQTGRWCTLQASSFLHTTVAGQVKSATSIGLYLSQQQVTVPAAGIWGYLGFTTKASLMATQPYLWGAVLGYGVVTVAVPLWYLQKCRGVWQETSERLNEAFWNFATRHAPLFCERLAEWSAY